MHPMEQDASGTARESVGRHFATFKILTRLLHRSQASPVGGRAGNIPGVQYCVRYSRFYVTRESMKMNGTVDR